MSTRRLAALAAALLTALAIAGPTAGAVSAATPQGHHLTVPAAAAAAPGQVPVPSTS